jgi:hypothetical protein
MYNSLLKKQQRLNLESKLQVRGGCASTPLSTLKLKPQHYLAYEALPIKSP